MAVEASPSGERQARRSRGRRVARVALATLVLVALAVVLSDVWLTPLARRVLVREARERFGAELGLERVSAGPFGIALEGVTWRSPRAPLLAVEEARVEVGFSPLQLLRERRLAGVRVEARGVEVELAPAGSGGGRAQLPDLPEIEIDLAGLVVRRPGEEPVRIARASGRGGLTGGIARVERLQVAAGESRLELEEAELDLAAPGWLALARSARGRLSAHLPDASPLVALLPRDVPLLSADLALTADAGRARLTGRATADGGVLDVERGELVLPSDGGLADLALDLELRADFEDLSALSEIARTPLEGRWRGSIDVQGSLRAPEGRFVGRGERVVVRGVSLDVLELDVRVDGETARFERCEARGPAFEAVLRGEVKLDPLLLDDVALDVSASAYALRAVLPVPCESAFVHARLSGAPSRPSGEFEASATGLQLGALRVDDAAARGRIDGDDLDVEELRVSAGESAIEAAGRLESVLDGWSAELERLALEWRGTRVELERGARIAFGGGRVTLDDVVLRSEGDAGEGSARLTLRHGGGTTRGALELDGYEAGALLAPFAPEGFAGGRASGRIEGELAGDASGVRSLIELDLALERWRVHPAWPALDATLRGGLDGDTLVLERLELGYGEEESASVRGSLRAPFDPRAPLAAPQGALEAELELASGDAARTLRRAGLEPGVGSTGPCRVAASLAGDWRAPAGTLSIEAEDVELGLEAGARSGELSAEIELGERVLVRAARLAAPSGSIELSGSIGTPFDVPRFREDRLALLEAPLALEAKLDVADVSWVAGLSAGVRRVSGQVAGKLAVTGTTLSPELDGTLELAEGELRLATLDFPVRELAASLRFEGQVVHVESLRGEVGGAPVRVSGTLEPFGPFPRLELELRGEELLVRRTPRLLLRTDVDVVVKGTPSQLSIRGDVSIAEGRYTGEISPFEELMRVGKRTQPSGPRELRLWSTEPLASAELDVHLGGARTFEYRTNLLEASVRPDLWLRGTGAFPVLEGPAYVEEASLQLPSGELELTSGVLTFRREAPLRPDIAFTAAMRVQRHDVRLAATGTLDELEIIPSSTPPLPRDDLLILVLTGQLPTNRWQDRSTQAMEALAVFLARDTLVRWFSDDPGTSESLLERFEIDVGARTSESGQPTGKVLFYLVPRNRRTGRATYLSAEIDEYDRYNYAFGIVFRPR